MKTQVLDVTPTMAQKWLNQNTDNRRIRPRYVEKLAEMMKRGEFILTHQGIAIAPGGRLLDGQHRLLAVVESNATVTMLVNTDVGEETFAYTDTGERRSFSDIFGVTVKDAAVSSYVVKILFHQPSVVQQCRVHEITSPVFRRLIEFCPTIKKIYTSQPIQTAAVVRILAGEDAEYIKLIYWHLAHVDLSGLPPIGRAFVNQIFSNGGQMKANKNDLFARAIKVFDQQARDTTRLMVTNNDSAFEFTRSVISPLIGKVKAPSSKQQAKARQLRLLQQAA